MVFGGKRSLARRSAAEDRISEEIEQGIRSSWCTPEVSRMSSSLVALDI